MPVHLPEILAAHLRTATYRPLDDEVFAAFFEQREGEQGQALWLAHVRALTRATRRSSIRSSTRRRRPRIDWDERDAWLDPAVSERIERLLPEGERVLLLGAGHLSINGSSISMQ